MTKTSVWYNNCESKVMFALTDSALLDTKLVTTSTSFWFPYDSVI